MWVETHFVYLGAYTTVPACLGQVDKVVILLVDLFEFELEVRNFVVSEIVCVL